MHALAMAQVMNKKSDEKVERKVRTSLNHRKEMAIAVSCFDLLFES